MSKVIYRDINKKDYEDIKKLICEAFGFDEFIKSEELLDITTALYLQECIEGSSFSKIAEKDNKVIGIILGKSNNDKLIVPEVYKKDLINEDIARTIMADEENVMVIKEFSKIQNTYKEIIAGKEDTFEGCIQLFIVSKESRGLGIGKKLLNYLFKYMKSREVNSIYLYTDTRCNYKFYDSQNFRCLSEKELVFDSINKKLDVFLYGYKFN